MTFEEWNNDKELKSFPCKVCINFKKNNNKKLCEICSNNDFCGFRFDENRLKDITLEEFRKKIFRNYSSYDD